MISLYGRLARYYSEDKISATIEVGFLLSSLHYEIGNFNTSIGLSVLIELEPSSIPSSTWWDLGGTLTAAYQYNLILTYLSLQGLNVLPGRAGGFTLIAARENNVYWWNNVTRALYSDTTLSDEDAATVIAG